MKINLSCVFLSFLSLSLHSYYEYVYRVHHMAYHKECSTKTNKPQQTIKIYINMILKCLEKCWFQWIRNVLFFIFRTHPFDMWPADNISQMARAVFSRSNKCSFSSACKEFSIFPSVLSALCAFCVLRWPASCLSACFLFLYILL